MGRTDQKLPLLQLHRLPQRLQGEARRGIRQGTFHPSSTRESRRSFVIPFMTARCEGFAPANCRFRWSRKRRRGQKSTYPAGISPHGIKGRGRLISPRHLLFIFFLLQPPSHLIQTPQKGGGDVFTSVACHEHDPTLVCASLFLSGNPFFSVCLFVCAAIVRLLTSAKGASGKFHLANFLR